MGTISDLNMVWSIISICYFIGGLTLGWYTKDLIRKRKKRGLGRWD